MSKKYDAFISYRHAELDMFVAETLQHELEKYKLPRNVIKTQKPGEKNRVNHIFRDRDALGLAPDLSAPIYEALDNSDFLIVICTPKLPESEWCRKEIEYFTRKHGRDKVLVVLAQGEPSTSFPPELIEDGEEPLAADIRGTDNRQIKKKIKSEVLRLAATMLGFSYEDLRQRHREQHLRKTLWSAIAIAVILLIFGSFSFAQAWRLKVKDNQINQLYLDNLIKQAALSSEKATRYLSEGDVTDAIDFVFGALPEEGQDTPEEVYEYVYSALSECLGVYTNGSEVRATHNLVADSRILDDDSPSIFISEDRKYAVLKSISGIVSFWNLETYKKVYEITDDNFNFNPNTSFAFAGDVFSYKLGDKVIGYDLAEGKEIYSNIIPSVCRIINLNSEYVLVFTYDQGIYKLRTANGVIEEKISSGILNLNSISSYAFSDDYRYLYMDCITMDGNELACMDLESFRVISHVDITRLYMNNYMFCMGDALYMTATEWTGDTIFISSLWKATADDLMPVKFYEKENQTLDAFYLSVNGRVIMSGTEGTNQYIYSIDPTDGSYMEHIVLQDIMDVFLDEDGTLGVYYQNGAYECCNPDDFYFSVKSTMDLPYNDSYEFISYVDGNCITYIMSSKLVTAYSRKVSDEATLTDHATTTTSEMLDSKSFSLDTYVTPGGNYTVNFIDNQLKIYQRDTFIRDHDISDLNPDPDDCNASFAISNDGSLLFVQTPSDTVQVFSVETDAFLFETPVLSGSLYYDDFDGYYVLADSSYAYVYAKDTNILYTTVYGYAGYDADNNCFYIVESSYDAHVYSVPFFTLDELMEMADPQKGEPGTES